MAARKQLVLVVFFLYCDSFFHLEDPGYMEYKNWQPLIILVCLSILIAVGGGWYYNKEYFTPNDSKIKLLNQELEKVKIARQAWDEALARGINGDAVYETRFNYFTKQDIPLTNIQPVLLKELTPFFEERQMDFLGLEQLEGDKADKAAKIDTSDKKELLTKIPFTINGGGSFKSIISLIRWLEEEKYAVVTRLSIFRFDEKEKNKQTESGLPFDYANAPHSDDWLSFSVSWHWVEAVPRNFTSMVSPPPLANLEVKKNPFRSYAMIEEQTVIPSKKKKDQEVIFQPMPEGFKLTGIMTVKDKFKAMVNNTYLEAGMNFNQFHVVEIKADEVILGKDNFRYRLRMERKQY